MTNKMKSRNKKDSNSVDVKHVKGRMPQVLLAEDDFEMRKILASALRKNDFEVIECSDGYQLLDHMGKPVFEGQPDDFDLIVSDIRMPGITGIEVLEGIHESKWFTPMILITAFGDEQTHAQAARLGAAAVFDKPFDIDDLLAKIREILVLDSPHGHNWSPDLFDGTITQMPPVDVVYNHLPKSEYVESLVQQQASRLLGLNIGILYFRIILIGPNTDDDSGRYHIQVMVTTPNKVFVVRSNLLEITDYQELVAAIPEAFNVVRGRIKKYLKFK